jgi:hypothetical protein
VTRSRLVELSTAPGGQTIHGSTTALHKPQCDHPSIGQLVLALISRPRIRLH